MLPPLTKDIDEAYPQIHSEAAERKDIYMIVFLPKLFDLKFRGTRDAPGRQHAQQDEH